MPRLSFTAIAIFCSDPDTARCVWIDECPREELDLLEIPARLPTELGAGSSQVVSAEALDRG